MQEMMRCQFCGENKALEVNKYNNDYAVHCILCGAIGPLEEDQETAVLSWNNRRKETPEMPKIVTHNFAKDYVCPIQKIKCCGKGCMMWVSVGDDKGRCGLVNTIYMV